MLGAVETRRRGGSAAIADAARQRASSAVSMRNRIDRTSECVRARERNEPTLASPSGHLDRGKAGARTIRLAATFTRCGRSSDFEGDSCGYSFPSRSDFPTPAYLPPLPNFPFRRSCRRREVSAILRCSFLLTAAGQPRIPTGFPFQRVRPRGSARTSTSSP